MTPALNAHAEALRALRGVPDIRPEPRWWQYKEFAPGQGWLCLALGIVIACELSFLGWVVFFRI